MLPPTRLLIVRDRYAALTPRERIFVAMGAAAIILFLLYMLWPDGEEPAVELATMPASTSYSTPASATPLPPPPMSATVPVVSAPALPATDTAAIGTIVLRGVMGGGPGGGAAIFDTPGGTQRVVRVGRDIVPGMVLREVGLRHVIATSGGGNVRLDLGKAGAQAVAPTVAPAAPAAPSAAAAGAEARAARETMQFRLGLEPVKSGGRILGFAVKRGAALPHLAGAGLQPGDVLLSVNGSQLDQERLMELSWEIANSGRTDIEFMRGGKRMKSSIPGRTAQ